MAASVDITANAPRISQVLVSCPIFKNKTDWGTLTPHPARAGDLDRYEFAADKTDFMIGRRATHPYRVSFIQLSKDLVSFKWNGKQQWDTAKITPITTVGVWVNGRRLKHGIACPLEDGDEINFTPPNVRTPENPGFVWFFFYNPDWDPVEIAKRAAAAARPKTGYTRNHHLGSGSYGDVFSGTENATGRVVALKTASRQAQLGFRTRGLGPFADIAHEYKALNGLKHPNLIGFLGFVGIAGTPYIVMEYANGGAFDDWIPKYRKENGHFPTLDEGRYLMYQICDGVRYLHAAGLIHRDIKPGNILVKTTDSQLLPTLKLSDFGFSKSLDASFMNQTMAGTPCFMAPEVIKRQPYGFTADSFSVGATACYMFCGHPPPDREDLKDDQVWDVEIKKSLDRISSLDTLSRHFIEVLLLEDPRNRWPMEAILYYHDWLKPISQTAPKLEPPPRAVSLESLDVMNNLREEISFVLSESTEALRDTYTKRGDVGREDTLLSDPAVQQAEETSALQHNDVGQQVYEFMGTITPQRENDTIRPVPASVASDSIPSIFQFSSWPMPCAASPLASATDAEAEAEAGVDAALPYLQLSSILALALAPPMVPEPSITSPSLPDPRLPGHLTLTPAAPVEPAPSIAGSSLPDPRLPGHLTFTSAPPVAPAPFVTGPSLPDHRLPGHLTLTPAPSSGPHAKPKKQDILDYAMMTGRVRRIPLSRVRK